MHSPREWLGSTSLQCRPVHRDHQSYQRLTGQLRPRKWHSDGPTQPSRIFSQRGMQDGCPVLYAASQTAPEKASRSYPHCSASGTCTAAPSVDLPAGSANKGKKFVEKASSVLASICMVRQGGEELLYICTPSRDVGLRFMVDQLATNRQPMQEQCGLVYMYTEGVACAKAAAARPNISLASLSQPLLCTTVRGGVSGGGRITRPPSLSNSYPSSCRLWLQVVPPGREGYVAARKLPRFATARRSGSP